LLAVDQYANAGEQVIVHLVIDGAETVAHVHVGNRLGDHAVPSPYQRGRSAVIGVDKKRQSVAWPCGTAVARRFARQNREHRSCLEHVERRSICVTQRTGVPITLGAPASASGRTVSLD